MDIIINNDFGEIYKFKVNKNDRIFDIKVQIQSWSTIPTDRQHLFYHDQELKDDKTVNDYKIKEEETIFNKISSISKDDNQNSQQPEPEQALLLPKSEQNRHQSESPNEDEKEDTSKIKIQYKITMKISVHIWSTKTTLFHHSKIRFNNKQMYIQITCN